MTNYFNSSVLFLGVYIDHLELMILVFRDGSTYEYTFVKKDIWFGLVRSESAGVFFQDNIARNPKVAVNRVG